MSKTIEVSDETYEKIKDQLSTHEQEPIYTYDSLVGKKWFFRTVTYHCVGEAIALTGKFVCLSNASWVADSGRFTQAIKEGQLNEVEPVGLCYVNLESVVDFFPWIHPLPKEQK